MCFGINLLAAFGLVLRECTSTSTLLEGKRVVHDADTQYFFALTMHGGTSR